MKIYLAKSSEEIEKCFPIMVQLRTSLSKEEFVKRVNNQFEQGYQLVYVKDKNQIVAVTGFRIIENLVYGKFIYVDDLVTDFENRGHGYGDKLFDFLVNLAKKEKCNEIHLDSGVQRFDAHRLYLRKRMNITAHHFGLSLKNEK